MSAIIVVPYKCKFLLLQHFFPDKLLNFLKLCYDVVYYTTSMSNIFNDIIILKSIILKTFVLRNILETRKSSHYFL